MTTSSGTDSGPVGSVPGQRESALEAAARRLEYRVEWGAGFGTQDRAVAALLRAIEDEEWDGTKGNAANFMAHLDRISAAAEAVAASIPGASDD